MDDLAFKAIARELRVRDCSDLRCHDSSALASFDKRLKKGQLRRVTVSHLTELLLHQ